MKMRLMGIFLQVWVCLLFSGCSGVNVGDVKTVVNYQAMVKQSLDHLIGDYEAKNGRQFAELVSDRYVGVKELLDTAVRRDFSAYHNLSVRYTLNNVTFDGKSKIFASVNFTRDWTDIKTTKTMNETRQTSLVFILENGICKLYSQSRPLLFGFN